MAYRNNPITTQACIETLNYFYEKWLGNPVSTYTRVITSETLMGQSGTKLKDQFRSVSRYELRNKIIELKERKVLQLKSAAIH